jgi:hypothetical protein
LDRGVMDKRVDKCLAFLRGWAEKHVATGNEPPWAWYQYMKLIETLAAIQTGRAAVTSSAAGSLVVHGPAEAPRGKEDGVADISTRRRRRRREEPPLPM